MFKASGPTEETGGNSGDNDQEPPKKNRLSVESNDSAGEGVEMGREKVNDKPCVNISVKGELRGNMNRQNLYPAPTYSSGKLCCSDIYFLLWDI